jgi:hypothetical protein
MSSLLAKIRGWFTTNKFGGCARRHDARLDVA